MVLPTNHVLVPSQVTSHIPLCAVSTVSKEKGPGRSTEECPELSVRKGGVDSTEEVRKGGVDSTEVQLEIRISTPSAANSLWMKVGDRNALYLITLLLLSYSTSWFSLEIE
jgi:hypothetical protein